ncbi:peptide ABC transporter substrate-binding protein [Nocardia otitidiscaviarum]|uniref:Peptide ABC transporter substrate-binding protein n=1 Tax=Nocardia otitidiscaviarum TaxID=1823 RepID=A0A516NJ20_9NOCA|nr:ABC transporter substrate-binding protein [Nocardia otitidiscaviarum]MCP9619665.1 ABC transporter substrate-binding protein [Nocardia otitidiscaviarum]QDP78891.1 peptide ABC transporter substrate-binding protein [Nocardia otitidiscaviarum]
MTGLAVLAVAGCGSGRTGGGGGEGIVVGTTDKIFSLDPAAAYDNGSLLPETQVYQFLLNLPPGETTPTPDAAEKCEFTDPTTYTCTLREGLTFANGNPLTSASVKFSFDRMLGINDPNGPASLLGNLEKTEAVDERTVRFTLKEANDQTFPAVLTTQAGPIVDEKVFPADRVLDDNEVVNGKPFSGPYSIVSYDKNKLVEYQANPDYNGALGTPKTDTISTRYYATTENMKLDVQNGAIDVAWRSLTPTDVDSLRADGNVTVHEGPGGELRYFVFNMNTMPGDTPEQKLAIRKAIASSIDREALATNVYKGTYTPAYSSVPQGFPGAVEPFKEIYGAQPNKDAAARFLADAGVATPVDLNLQYNSDHYGSSSSEEYAAIKTQLESTGLFRVNLQSTEWVSYQRERARDAYPIYQLGWFPDFADPDNYLTPFFGPNNFLQNHFEDPAITAQLVAESTEPDKTKRLAIIEAVQADLARDHISIVPLLAGKQIAVAGNDIQGLEQTLDPSFRFRFGVLSK